MIDTVNAFIRIKREEAGLTQRELAEKAGLSLNTIGYIECKEKRSPKLLTIKKIAKALDIDIAEFIDKC